MLTHEAEGLLFDPGKAGAIEAAVARLWQAPEEALAFGRAAARRARADHDPAAIARQLAGLYTALLKEE